MGLFNDYGKVYDLFLQKNCEFNLFEHYGINYFMIIYDVSSANGRIERTFKRKFEDEDEKFRKEHFEEYLSTNQPFIIINIILNPVDFNLIHQFNILYRPKYRLLEFIDPQPLEDGNTVTDLYNTIQNYYNVITEQFTSFSKDYGINILDNKETYRYFNGYPPQYLENEIIENLNPEWEGRTCIFWSTLITLQLLRDDITFVNWLGWFLMTFNNNTKSDKLIRWLKNSLDENLLICQRYHIFS